MMRGRLIAGLVGIVVVSAACTAPVETVDTSEVTAEPLRSPDTEEAAFLKLINDYRASQGLGSVVATPLLNQVAYDHSLDMGTNAYFDHNDQAGHSPFDRMKTAGYKGGYMAENIAAGNADAQATFTQWKNSAGHNANMLGTHYKAIGIGRAYVAGSPYRYYWTTDFGDVIDGSATSGGGGTSTGGGGTSDGGTTAPPTTPPPSPTPTPPPAACNGDAESEPNGDYRAPNALAATSCGAIGASGDQDWFTWSVPAAGVKYDVKVSGSGDANVAMWKLVNGQYSRIANTTATEIANTSSGAGQYVVLVWSPGSRAQSYTLTLAH